MRVVVVLLALVLGGPSAAAEAATSDDSATLFPVPDYSGDLLERERALGDPGGWRSQLAQRGVQFEVDFTQVYQGIVDGTGDGADEYTGSLDYVMKVDIDKMRC
jgi:carbohydrate-selective porin OprB